MQFSLPRGPKCKIQRINFPLNIILADRVKEGCPTLAELQDLAQKLDKWNPLRRHFLHMDESKIEHIKKNSGLYGILTLDL